MKSANAKPQNHVSIFWGEIEKGLWVTFEKTKATYGSKKFSRKT